MIYTDNTQYSDYLSAVAAVLNIYDTDTGIEVDFKEKCDGNAGGYCYGDQEEITIEIALNVQGEKLTEQSIQRNIAHEMIHAEQIISGRLQDLGLQILDAGDSQVLAKVAIWQGETHTNTMYDDQPWEIEAYAREEQVMKEALQYV